MTSERTPRTRDTRQEQARTPDKWVPQGMLPVPDPQDGWVFRWIRTSARGNSDNSNVSKKFREGWRPVTGSDHPELQAQSDLDSRYPDGIEIGGLLLCKCPAEMMKQRQDHYTKLSERQLSSVDQDYMRQGDPRMPLHAPERRTETSFGPRVSRGDS